LELCLELFDLGDDLGIERFQIGAVRILWFATAAASFSRASAAFS